MNYAIIIPLIFVLILVLIETILAAKWNPFYFEKTIPLHTKLIPFTDIENTKLGLIHFINHLDTYKGLKKYIGIIADENTFYFRKKMVSSGKNNFDDIHGSITIDSENRHIILKIRMGFSYIIAMCFMFYFLSFVDGFDIFTAIVFLIVVIIIRLISFAIERSVLNKMINELTNAINN